MFWLPHALHVEAAVGHSSRRYITRPNHSCISDVTWYDSLQLDKQNIDALLCFVFISRSYKVKMF